MAWVLVCALLVGFCCITGIPRLSMTTLGPIAANRGPVPPTPTAADPKPAASAPTTEPRATADSVQLRAGPAADVRSDDPALAEAAKAAPQALLDAGSGALGAQAVPDDLLALLD